jgi:nitrate/TMAO reductase-like tetraheme cytochrome c subunit
MSDRDSGGGTDRPGLVLLSSHWLVWLGLAFAITAFSTWLFFLPAEVGGHGENPYKGVVVYLVLPAVFAIGIVLATVGMLLARKRVGERLRKDVVDRGVALKRLIAFVVFMIVANLAVGTQVTYRAVLYMDTPNFCGATCHVMRPQYLGHRDSNHASVPCAECHVAPGAGGWFEAKMNGTRQLWETLTGGYSRPVPSALESGRLVPSTETCEHCHWAAKIVATRLLVIPKYAPDEGNTVTYTVLMMIVGGSKMRGIHNAHFAGGFDIRYASDPKRQNIPWVERRNTRTGEVQVYLADGVRAEQAAQLPKYQMQCVDCHDRPTHAFWLPDRAMDRALALGELSGSLPFIKRQGLAALKVDYSSTAEAAEAIPKAIAGFYQQAFPSLYATRKAEIMKAGRAVLSIYEHNVFPELRVTWGTYTNSLGHTDSPGCFRCHDGSHATATGQTISQDCSACHEVLATDEPEPAALKTMGLWEHMVSLSARNATQAR